MNFKFVKEYIVNADTIVNFITPRTHPKFNSVILQDAYDSLYKDDQPTLENGKILTLRIKVDKKFVNVLLVALDETDKKVHQTFQICLDKLNTRLNILKSEIIYIDNIGDLSFYDSKKDLYRELATLLYGFDYRFDYYLTEKKELMHKDINIFETKDYSDAINEGVNIGKAVEIARDLANEPANVLSPEELANRTIAYGKTFGFDVDVLEKEQCEELGMGAFLSVAKASASKPKFIIMRYYGGTEDELAKGLIGKGICYDSGGLFLKPGARMKSMNGDMCGAAAVIAGMCAIASNKLEKNVIAIVAACENLIDGEGYRNGDILTSMSGKTIYVGSTDAEGRLTLADAITYMVRNEKIDSIVEFSTLTGASATYFGGVCAPIYTTNDGLFQAFESISEEADEKFWRMPTFEEYQKNITCEIADLYNTSSRGAGGITGGVFLDAFSEGVPFMHIDIAGSAFKSIKPYGKMEGGTGFGVKSIYYYLK